MKHKIFIAAVCLIGSSSLFAQTQEPAQTEPKSGAQVKTAKPAKSSQPSNTGKAQPLSKSTSQPAKAAERRQKPAPKEGTVRTYNPSF